MEEIDHEVILALTLASRESEKYIEYASIKVGFSLKDDYSDILNREICAIINGYFLDERNPIDEDNKSWLSLGISSDSEDGFRPSYKLSLSTLTLLKKYVEFLNIDAYV